MNGPSQYPAEGKVGVLDQNEIDQLLGFTDDVPKRVVREMVRSMPTNWYAIGWKDRRGFHIRRLVSGQLLARAEKRKGEIIRRAFVSVAAK